MASAPKRAKSYRDDAVAISSIPQQAVANGIGQSELRRAQLTTFFNWVVRTLSGSCWVSIMMTNSETHFSVTGSNDPETGKYLSP
jgi:hypothetical protein